MILVISLSKNTEAPEPADEMAGNNAGFKKSLFNIFGRNTRS